MNEIFKDIVGYEGSYQISNLGNVKSIKFKKEKILKAPMNTGYRVVCLSLNNKNKVLYVHQLVAMAFLNHTPNGYNGLIVDHINNIKTDNRLENLQLISNRENTSKDRKGCTSKYTGVCWNKRNNKWLSQIIINGKTKYIGCFNCELEAHLEYQKELEMLKQS